MQRLQVAIGALMLEVAEVRMLRREEARLLGPGFRPRSRELLEGRLFPARPELHRDNTRGSRRCGTCWTERSVRIVGRSGVYAAGRVSLVARAPVADFKPGRRPTQLVEHPGRSQDSSTEQPDDQDKHIDGELPADGTGSSPDRRFREMRRHSQRSVGAIGSRLQSQFGPGGLAFH